MEIFKYITEHALILIPVLIIIGHIIKGFDKIPDKYIPLILLPFGIIGSMELGSWNWESGIQGILVTGAAVYSDQLVKQLRKEE